ncbi:hypothetical protein CWI39_1714p0010 [Hamiltosporidium magnivora]|uniref:Reverse transcriptase domain-containing protein n=1 Tax=Hamiltosporidium magnivora TaxID=148818 RepID=A0A4Q9KZ97_9MICR|nr:hypothetical protein CWI39_1714p0010 [Hamiltosporidium magnivora]
MGVIMRSEMHEEPTPPLKEEKREEDGAKNFKPKYKAPFILQGGTTLEEPTNNINEESDLEEETKTDSTIFNGITQYIAYADNLAIVGRKQEDIGFTLRILAPKSGKSGLKMNESKTKYMISSQ